MKNFVVVFALAFGKPSAKFIYRCACFAQRSYVCMFKVIWLALGKKANCRALIYLLVQSGSLAKHAESGVHVCGFIATTCEPSIGF